MRESFEKKHVSLQYVPAESRDYLGMILAMIVSMEEAGLVEEATTTRASFETSGSLERVQDFEMFLVYAAVTAQVAMQIKSTERSRAVAKLATEYRWSYRKDMGRSPEEPIMLMHIPLDPLRKSLNRRLAAVVAIAAMYVAAVATVIFWHG